MQEVTTELAWSLLPERKLHHLPSCAGREGVSSSLCLSKKTTCMKDLAGFCLKGKEGGLVPKLGAKVPGFDLGDTNAIYASNGIHIWLETYAVRS